MTYPHGGASEIWRDGDGGAHNPEKGEVRDWGETVELSIDALQESATQTDLALDGVDGQLAALEAMATVGVNWLAPADVAATANIALSGEQTIDGVLTAASRVLVLGQIDATENGVYVSDAGAWSRAADLNAASEFERAAIYVLGGTASGGASFYCATTGITLGVTNISFVQIEGKSGQQALLEAALDDLADLQADVPSIKRKTSGALIEGSNLFDKTDPDVVAGYFVSHTDGTMQANADYSATGFIPVVSGQTYYLTTKSFMAWYDADKAFISGSSSSDTSKVQAAPAGAAFLRTSLHTGSGASFDALMVVLGGAAPTEYEPFGGTLNPERLSDVGSDSLADGAVTPKKTSFLESSKNLFDKMAVTPDTFAGANGSLGSSADYALSDFIEVEAGQTYYGAGSGNGMRFWTAYDENKSVVAAEGSNDLGTSFTVPASGVKFYRVTVYTSNLDSFQLEKGAVQTGYEPFGFYFSDQVLGESGASGPYSGLSWASLGDSITAQNKWQTHVVAELGLVHTNYGVGGSRISGPVGSTTAMCQDARLNAIPTATDVITFNGGVNDWAGDVPLGAVGSSDPEEFYGALNTMFEKAFTRWPDKRLAAMTTTYGELYNYAPRGWSNAYTNNVGLTCNDYAEAMRVASKRWNVPVIDVNQDCGWNTLNLTSFITDDGGLLHPNDAGGERMAAVVSARLLDLKPVA